VTKRNKRKKYYYFMYFKLFYCRTIIITQILGFPNGQKAKSKKLIISLKYKPKTMNKCIIFARIYKRLYKNLLLFCLLFVFIAVCSLFVCLFVFVCLFLFVCFCLFIYLLMLLRIIAKLLRGIYKLRVN
jgi:hypothetical protein